MEKRESIAGYPHCPAYGLMVTIHVPGWREAQRDDLLQSPTEPLQHHASHSHYP